MLQFHHLALTLLVVTRALSHGEESCVVKSNGLTGQCKPLTSCPEIIKEFTITNITGFLEEHGCGVKFETKNVLVCCPLSTILFKPDSNDYDNSTNNQCGRRRIGKASAKWPFHVGIGHNHPTKDLIGIRCNGVLISKDWVLTHAYCITDYVVAHVYLKIGLAKYEEIIKVPIESQKRLESYDRGRDQNAIALVKLKTSVRLSDDVQLVCLPPVKGFDPPSDRYITYIGKIDDGSVAGGFEVTEHRRNRVELNECRRSATIPVFPTVDHLCTDGVRACNISLNKPLLIGLNDKGGWTILGVGGQWRDRCSSDVTLFTAVSSYLPWIYETIGQIPEKREATQGGENEVLELRKSTVVECGRRVVGQGGHWPFIVSLGSTSGQGIISHCTGVLLEADWVLTDAKCLQTNKIDFATVGFNMRSEEATNIKINSNYHLPSYFNSSYHHNSVALVQLSGKINFNDNIQPGCLQQSGSQYKSKSLFGLSSGYSFTGHEATLKTNMMPINRMDEMNCLISLSVPFNAQDHSYICTTNIQACRFIASPPVLMEQEAAGGTFTVVGVGGDNSDFCRGDYMGFVRVEKHLPWILNTVYFDQLAKGTRPIEGDWSDVRLL